MRRRDNDSAEAFRQMYRAHVRPVYAFFAYSVSAHVAEDLTASTFERALRAFDRYDPAKASERTWLLTIARNILTDHYRRQQHRRVVSTDEHPALLDRLIATDDPLARRATMDGLVAWLQELDPRQQEVLALRFGADMSASEIAEALDISESNVHQIASRAVRRLRHIAEREGTIDSA